MRDIPFRSHVSLFSSLLSSPANSSILTSLNCHLHQLKAVQEYHWALPKFSFTLQPRNWRNKPWYSEDSFLLLPVSWGSLSLTSWCPTSFGWLFHIFLSGVSVVLQYILSFATSSITKAEILLTFYSVLSHLLMTAVLISYFIELGDFFKSSFFSFF